MSEKENKLNNAGSANEAGSPDKLIENVPSANEVGGETAPKTQDIDLSKYVSKDNYEELEKKLGTQGSELGEFRDFFTNISPLLEKLDGSPELVEAILEGKVDSKSLEAISKGEASVEDVSKVSKAHTEVKKELGLKKYESLKKEDIEKLVDAKIGIAFKTTNDKLDDRDFENSVDAFIKTTPDFSNYAEEISSWFEAHPDQFDVEIAYNAVKGKALIEFEMGENEKKAAEEAKEIAANAGGGGSQGAQISKDKDVIDSLISNSPNPNAF